MTEKISYVVYFASTRPCSVVYTMEVVSRLARSNPIDHVVRTQTKWSGTWDDGTRRFEEVDRVVVDPDLYRPR